MRTLPKYGPSSVSTATSQRATYATENNDGAVDGPTNIRTANAFVAINGQPYNAAIEDALLTCQVTRGFRNRATGEVKRVPILPRFAAHKPHRGYYGDMTVKTRSRVSDREPTADQLIAADKWARAQELQTALAV